MNVGDILKENKIPISVFEELNWIRRMYTGENEY